MKLLLFLSIFLVVCSEADTYDDDYNLFTDSEINKEKKLDPFMYGDFDEIIRFEPLQFNDDEISKRDVKILDEIVDKTKQYQEEFKTVKIKIIGHATKSEKSKQRGEKYALYVQKYFTDSQLDLNITTVENRVSKDPAYTFTTTDGELLSNRVMVTMYVTKSNDLDNDGVNNKDDKCPDTKEGIKIGKDGCKLKTMIVLLPGDKKNSSIIVGTKKGSIVVDKPNYFVSLASKDEKPSVPKLIEEKELNELMGDIVKETKFKEISYSLYFNGSKLTTASKVLMDDIILEIDKRENAYINIIGHTDTIDAVRDNDKMGLKRANVVADIIKELSIGYLKIDVSSHSELDLAVQTKDEVFEPLNRRVEIFIH